ncbi:MAG TPA: transglycosylase domain-containing protein [Micromonosporaceae bacterium]|jgi:membrane peptidoglycan carboxypeptidase
MNSHGDPSSARGRAHVPGATDGREPDHAGNGSAASSGWPANVGAYAPRAAVPAGRASVGRASVGRATVGGIGTENNRHAQPTSLGRASVPGVGVASGRATVGRAAVRPVVPGGGFGVAGPGGVGPGGPGRPGGPGGPSGPGGAGGRGRNDPAALKRAKRRRLINWLAGGFAVFSMVAGGAVVGGTYYFENVPTPAQLKLPETTTLYYTDGQTQLAKLAEENRIQVPVGQILPYVKQAVISAEDRNFYQHGGVDYAGIARAAWNNFTGGETQGASTITQQYARHAANLTGVTYARKVREAVIASKLNSQYSKDEILGFYLNTIPFGRGAYGIEAAAKAYFGPNKSVIAKPGTPQAVTPAEAAVLAAVIKQPEPVAGGHPGYDPTRSPQAAALAKDRWNYVLDGMVQKHELDAVVRAKMVYPKVLKEDLSCIQGCGQKTPVGNVINYVKDEMQQMGICDSPQACSQALKTEGYKITTTVDPRIQKAAENATRRVKGSPMYGQPKNLMDALVAIDPSNGRVLAYYGGETGVGTDYAGLNYDGSGGHAPGSSFKIYTLAAALQAGKSVDSHWDATKTVDDNGTPTKRDDFVISNAGRTNLKCDNGGKWCTLEQAAIESYNVPFYWITKEIGAGKVVDAAKAAGVTHLWNQEKPFNPVDLTKIKSGDEVAPSKFGTQVGYGQYWITVLDHANGIATFANRGVYHKAHFIVKVEQNDHDTGKWKAIDSEKVKGEQRFVPEQVDDETSVLEKIPAHWGHRLEDGRPALGKTGTWELNSKSKENGDAWMIGATRQIAAAVWVGNVKDRLPIRDKNHVKVGGSGLPGDIWQQFMDEANRGLPEKAFPDRKGTGDVDSGNGVSPSPDGQKSPCIIPLFCPGDGNGNGNGGGGHRFPNPTPPPPAGGIGGGIQVSPSPTRRQ